MAGVTQDAVRPGETLRLPLPPRAGRHVLVPHAPGRLEGGREGPLRRARDHARDACRRRKKTSSCPSTRSPGTSRSARTTACSGVAVAAGSAGAPAADQHGQHATTVPASRACTPRSSPSTAPRSSRRPSRPARRSRSAAAAATTSGSRRRSEWHRSKSSAPTAALVISPNGPGRAGLGALTNGVRPRRAHVRAAPSELGSTFDRTFQLEITKKPGFLDGKPGRHWALNGKIYPRVPMFEVAKGDLVRIDLVNDTPGIHPMHLHGHHFLVLSRNGKAVQPWSTDTLDMLPHERYGSRSARTTRGSGCCIATTSTTRRTASRCTSCTRRHDALPGREVGPQRSRVASAAGGAAAAVPSIRSTFHSR